MSGFRVGRFLLYWNRIGSGAPLFILTQTFRTHRGAGVPQGLNLFVAESACCIITSKHTLTPSSLLYTPSRTRLCIRWILFYNTIDNLITTYIVRCCCCCCLDVILFLPYSPLLYKCVLRYKIYEIGFDMLKIHTHAYTHAHTRHSLVYVADQWRG